MECGKTRNDCFHDIVPKKINLNKLYAEKFSKTTGIEIQSQHWGVNGELSMEGIAVEYFTNPIDPSINEKYEFN